MSCVFCKVEMKERDELCWFVGQDVRAEPGERYATRYTCPKCGDYFRGDYEWNRQKIVSENMLDKIKNALEKRNEKCQ